MTRVEIRSSQPGSVVGAVLRPAPIAQPSSVALDAAIVTTQRRIAEATAALQRFPLRYFGPCPCGDSPVASVRTSASESVVAGATVAMHGTSMVLALKTVAPLLAGQQTSDGEQILYGTLFVISVALFFLAAMFGPVMLDSSGPRQDALYDIRIDQCARAAEALLRVSGRKLVSDRMACADLLWAIEAYSRLSPSDPHPRLRLRLSEMAEALARARNHPEDAEPLLAIANLLVGFSLSLDDALAQAKMQMANRDVPHHKRPKVIVDMREASARRKQFAAWLQTALRRGDYAKLSDGLEATIYQRWLCEAAASDRAHSA